MTKRQQAPMSVLEPTMTTLVMSLHTVTGVKSLIEGVSPWDQRTINYTLTPSGIRTIKYSSFVNQTSTWLIELNFEDSRLLIHPLRWNEETGSITEIKLDINPQDLKLIYASLQARRQSASEKSAESFWKFRSETSPHKPIRSQRTVRLQSKGDIN